ncbi:hypothetical protein ECZU45_00950 [Escherichia coli]|nr:hypothetical protein ECZU45_00950 [Escherichia coli]
MDNVSLRHVIRLILSVTERARLPGLRAADAALSAGLEVASRAATALDPRPEALKQCATRLHAIYVDQLVQRCTGDAIENGVDAMTIMRRGRLLPRYQQLPSAC